MRRVSETVQHEVYSPGQVDAHGNRKDTWAASVNVGVYAFDPGGAVEPLTPGHDRVVTTPTIYAPIGVRFGARDRVTVRGVRYEVDGDSRDWVHPEGAPAGTVTTLRRVDG